MIRQRRGGQRFGQAVLQRRRLDQPDAAGLARDATDRPGLLQRFQMVLGGADALEAERTGDFGLRRRCAIGLYTLGDQLQDRLLGIGQVHG